MFYVLDRHRKVHRGSHRAGAKSKTKKIPIKLFYQRKLSRTKTRKSSNSGWCKAKTACYLLKGHVSNIIAGAKLYYISNLHQSK